MFCKIELIPKKDICEERTKELVWDFLVSLHSNGQILKDYKFTKEKNYTLYVTLPKQDSLDEKYDSKYVKRNRANLYDAYETVLTPLGRNMEIADYCTCKSRSAMEMVTYTRDIDSVFVCLDCGKSVALYELPLPADKEEDYWLVNSWQDNYSSMDILWINSLFDRYTGNQRVKHDSVLNKSGIKIAEYMSEKLGYPIYYHLECDYGNSVKAEQVGDKQIHICPKCGKLMKRLDITDNDSIDVCAECRLSYDAH